jgi:hypothetical protein
MRTSRQVQYVIVRPDLAGKLVIGCGPQVVVDKSHALVLRSSNLCQAVEVPTAIQTVNDGNAPIRVLKDRFYKVMADETRSTCYEYLHHM